MEHRGIDRRNPFRNDSSKDTSQRRCGRNQATGIAQRRPFDLRLPGRAARLFTDANARTNLPERPNVDQYMMGIAEAVKARANCQGSRIGALLVLEGRIVSTGYNGVPSNMKNCDQGGCERCANPEQYPSGTGYDVCICVHAEQNALLAAARFGIAVEGAMLYSTMRPCFGCSQRSCCRHGSKGWCTSKIGGTPRPKPASPSTKSCRPASIDGVKVLPTAQA